jgi:hypothetical protein
MHNKRRRLLATLLAAIVAIGALVGGVTLARADGETDAPAPGYSKTLADNGDGTYTLKLSVTGSQTKTEETKGAHVIFVADVSGSMNDSVSNTPSYVEDNSGESTARWATSTSTCTTRGRVGGAAATVELQMHAIIPPVPTM